MAEPTFPTEPNAQTGDQLGPTAPIPQRPKRRLRKILLVAGAVILILLVVIAWLAVEKARAPAPGDDAKTESSDPSDENTVSEGAPRLKTEEVAGGRDHVWDIAFLPTKELVFSERNGNIRLLQDGNIISLASIDNVSVGGEGGLMGLAVDPEFADNRYLYACYNSTDEDVRVVRWKVNAGQTGLEDKQDIVTGMPSNPSGRHSGCQLEFGPDGYLWVGTGDSAQGLTPQDPQSLGGKILRIGRDGQAAPDNQGGGFDGRVYSYGHRNTQGLAFFAAPIGGVPGVSVEHGSDVDDEVNPLTKGNFGWAPPEGSYDESGVPMTDKERFPDAVEAVWKSGDPTQAPSGVAVLRGEQWKGWDGALAVSVLKDKHLKILRLDDSLTVVKEEKVLAGDFGRLRAAVLGPDGALYISTDNGGGQDKIIRLTPQP